MNTSNHEDDDLCEGMENASLRGQSAEELIWHSTDSAVKPIVGNRKIERVAEPRWEARSLPFAAMSLQEVLDSSVHKQEELEAFLTHIYRAIAGAAPMKDKLNVLAYFETLCSDTKAANMLINSSLAVLFVRMLKNAKAPTLRVRLASVIGLLVRHATYIADELATTGILDALAETLRDKNERVRRRAMATMGELLFYIATQQQDTPAGGKGQDIWQVSAGNVSAVLRLLKAGEDDVAQHYAVKTIENISSQDILQQRNDWAAKFCTSDSVSLLVQIYNSTRSEGLKSTAASTLSRLLRYNAPLVNFTVDRFGVRLLLSGLSESNAKVQTAAVNMLSMALSCSDLSGRTRASLAEERSLVTAVVSLLESSLPTLRAKGLVALVFLCRVNSRYLLDACKSKAIPIVERLARDKDLYVRSAVGALQSEAVAVLSSITQQVTAELEQQARGRGAPRPRSGGSHLDQFPVVLHLLTSPAFRSAVVTPALISDLSKYLAVILQPGANFTGLDDFKTSLLHSLEALSQNMETLLAHSDSVVSDLLPALTAAVGTRGEAGDTRFMCLKLLCDILLLYMTEPDIYAGDRGAPSASSAQIDTLVQNKLMPLMPVLLQSEEPMPLYTLKLLGALLEVKSSWVDAIHQQGLVVKFFEFLSLDHSNNNVHNIRLCRLVILAGNVQPSAMASLEVVPKVVQVLEYAHENRVEPFLEPVLELCEAILECDARGGSMGSGQLVSGQLVTCYDIFLDLALHPDPPLSMTAAQCQLALLNTHPQAASANLLSTEGAEMSTRVLEGPSEQSNGLPRHKTQALMLETLRRALTAVSELQAGPDHANLLAAMNVIAEQGDKSVRMLAQETAAALKEAMQR